VGRDRREPLNATLRRAGRRTPGTDDAERVPPPPGRRAGSTEWRLIAAGFVVYLALVTALLVIDGYFPTIDLLAIAFFPVALLLRRGRTFLADWIPFGFLLLAYEEFRGLAAHWNGHVHVGDIAALERLLFGSPIPTVRLQEALYQAGHVGVMDVLTTGLYFLHFVGVLGVAFWLWMHHDRRTYWRYILAVLVLSYLGFATYAIFPSMPPRLAYAQGAVQPLTDIFEYTVGHFVLFKPFFTVYQLIDPNPYAAMPSLHIGYPFLVFLVAVRLWPGRRSWLVALYPLAMSFAVVYLGQHYVVDCVAGALYAMAAFWLVWDAPDWVRRRMRARTAGVPAPVQVRADR
jgi:membrane-associated phospholipid phosphatase